MKKLPDQIKLKITEKDIKASAEFTDNSCCLIATALKRRGYNRPHVLPSQVRINGVTYNGDISTKAVGWNPMLQVYEKEAVGRTHILTR